MKFSQAASICDDFPTF